MSKRIFIDESGNCDLQSECKSGQKYFIVSAIILDENKYHSELVKLNIRLRELVGNGELKSSNIGNNHKRRIKVLNSICEIDFKIYGLVVDKNLIIPNSGLRFKRSFVSFISGMVCEKIFSSFKDVSIKADKCGSKEFQTGLEKYIIKKKSDSILFDDSNFKLEDSKDEKFIQVADILAGTLAKIQQKSVAEEISREFLQIIKEKIIYLDYWPPYKKSVISEKIPDDISDRNYWNYELVKRYSIDIAIDYINSTPSFGNKDVEMRKSVLKFLLFQINGSEKNSFVYSGQIIKHVREDTGHKINLHTLSAKIISKLRGGGLIISSGEKGYKIPCKVSDIVEYVKTTDQKVVSMLQRIKKRLML